MDDRTVDPGWPRGQQLLWTLIPMSGYGMSRRLIGDGLVALRQMFLKFAAIWIWVGFVVLLFVPPEDSPPNGWIALVVAVGIAAVIGVAVIHRVRRLDCSSERALGSSYRARTLTMLGVAIVPFAFGFFAAVADGRVLYLLAAPCAVVALAIAAPSVRDVRRSQARLEADGCIESLVGALRTA